MANPWRADEPADPKRPDPDPKLFNTVKQQSKKIKTLEKKMQRSEARKPPVMGPTFGRLTLGHQPWPTNLVGPMAVVGQRGPNGTNQTG